MKTIEDLANWGMPQQAGEKWRVRYAEPTSEFWEYWRCFKNELQNAGIQICKVDSKKMLSWFSVDELNWNTVEFTDESDYPEPKSAIDGSGLRDYQVRHAQYLLDSLYKYNAALDASDTGTGKTFVSAAVCRQLNRTPLVVCPKAVIPTWNKVFKQFGFINFDITNYEKIIRGTTSFCSRYGRAFVWNEIPLLIFDEVHRCSGYETLNSELLKAARKAHIPILALSATVAEDPMELDALGYALQLHKEKDFLKWAISMGVGRGFTKPWEYKGGDTGLKKLHGIIFPDHGSRISISSLGNKFPETQITAEAFFLGEKETNEIEEAYAEIYEDHKQKYEDAELPVTRLLRARQLSELKKTSVFQTLIEDILREKTSVAVFVNFTQTLLILREIFPDAAFVDGSQKTVREREEQVARFQNDETRVILCNIESGGVGLSLHDVRGQYRRVALISPTYKGKTMQQVLGRVHRDGSLSKSLQRIVFAAGTVEEKACQAVMRKLQNMALINDGDLNAGLPMFETHENSNT